MDSKIIVWGKPERNYNGGKNGKNFIVKLY